MSFLPKNTSLGKLEIVEVYEYYDRPVLFTCQNQTGILFLAVWANEDDNGDWWFYTPISQRRFEHIRSGAIDLFSAFSKAEDDIVFSIYIPFGPDVQVIEKTLVSSSIPKENLPEPGEKLELPTITLHEVLDAPKQRATQTRREQIDLVLETILRERTEVPASQLGAVLRTFQTLINTIGNKRFGSGAIKGSFSQKTIVNMQLNAIGFGPGSFKVNLASATTANLFDETDVGDCVSAFLNLVRVSEDSSTLHSHLMDLGARVASSYIEFLEAINFDLRSVKIDWGSPNPNYGGSATISSEAAQRTAKTIRSFEEQASREIEVAGVLIGANLRTMKFEVEIGESSIAGDIDSSAKELIKGAVINAVYTFRIREVEIFKPMLEQSAIDFYLLDLKTT